MKEKVVQTGQRVEILHKWDVEMIDLEDSKLKNSEIAPYVLRVGTKQTVISKCRVNGEKRREWVALDVLLRVSLFHLQTPTQCIPLT